MGCFVAALNTTSLLSLVVLPFLFCSNNALGKYLCFTFRRRLSTIVFFLNFTLLFQDLYVARCKLQFMTHRRWAWGGSFTFLKKNKSHTYEPRFVCWWRKRDLCCVFRKKKSGTRDEVRAVLPNVLTALEHMGWLWGSACYYYVCFVRVSVCAEVFDDDHLRKRTHDRFLFFVYLYDFHFIGSLFTALSKL